MMMSSLTDNTIRQYDPCIRRWFSFCQERYLDIYDVSVAHILNYLVDLYNSGSKYSSINCAKSALSLLLSSELTSDLKIKRFMKGIYKLRTPLPRYNTTWDPAIVLNHLNSWYPNDTLSFDLLSKKLVTLLALITAHRVQTLSKIRITNITKIRREKFIIRISDQIKTSGLGKLQPLLSLPYFDENPSICPARALEQYLLSSASKRQENCDFLFIGVKRPHKSVCSQSLSRWIKATLQESGIDTSLFSAHSTRHASTSAARRLGVSIDLIKKTAGWTGNSASFARFYNREVTNETPDDFALTLCGLAST